MGAAHLVVADAGRELGCETIDGVPASPGVEGGREKLGFFKDLSLHGRMTGVQKGFVEIDDLAALGGAGFRGRPAHARPNPPHQSRFRRDCDQVAHEVERAPRLLVLRASIAELPGMGAQMLHDNQYGRRLAQNLIELLAPYEEELMQLEREAPAYGPLRRAIGIVIAEACYCVTDRAPADQSLPTGATRGGPGGANG